MVSDGYSRRGGERCGAVRDDATVDERRSDDELGDGDLSDLLSELRILLPGAQTLTAFLIILPFNGGLAQIQAGEQYVYVATFLCALVSLILLSAPAAQHRVQRPLRDRTGFKTQATRLIVIGMAFLALALALASQLVLDEVLHLPWLSWAVAGGVAVLLVTIWWLTPLRRKGVGDRG
jgi:hypothetical protein